MNSSVRLKWMMGLAFTLLAFFLRTSGLSHDLHLGKVYHPDTPKQIRAVERFLQGDYYTVIGGRDYEGYPLFNSHLVEYLIRAYQFAGGFISGHLGLSGQVDQPDYLSIFWFTRILNATLSAAAVWLVFLIGWRWLAPVAGIVAALLLTFSPVDITACHYANGDTAAAFFALLGVYLALRLLEKPSLPLYLAAGLVAAAAFSSKYHGGIALGTAGLAHIFYYAKARRLFSGASIGRGLLLVFAFIAGVFLTSPALLVYADGAFEDIVQFFEYTASFGMTEEMRAMSTWERFRMGMSVNMPVLNDVIGIIPAIAAILALIAGLRRPPVWIIASLPLVYILAGLATKPLTHAVYHTMATPGIMLLAGFTLYKLQAGQCMLWPRRITVIALAAAATSYLAAYTHRELFFFRHNDTRYLAESWARENIPFSFKLFTGPYTFNNRDWFAKDQTHAQEQSAGRAFAFSERTGPRAPDGAIMLHQFALEDKRLVVFRNWPQYLFAKTSDLIQGAHPRPAFCPLPTEQAVNLIDADAPWWLRHQGTRALSHGQVISGSITSTNPLDSIAWYVRNTDDATAIKLWFGGVSHRLNLRAGESTIVQVQNAKPARYSGRDRDFFDWRMRSLMGSLRISLLASRRDLAWAHFNLGNYEAARDLLRGMPANQLSGGDMIMYGISSLATASDLPAYIKPPVHVNLYEHYGVSTSFLEQLPGFSFVSNAWERVITTDERSGEYLFSAYHLPELSLDPGFYTLELEGMWDQVRLELVLTDPVGRILEKRSLDYDTASGAPLPARFSVDISDSRLKIGIRFKSRDDRMQLTGVSVKPDLESTLNSYARLYSFMLGDAVATNAGERFWYQPLKSLGDHQLNRGQTNLALRCYKEAAISNPARLGALEQLIALEHNATNTMENLAPLIAFFKSTKQHRESIPLSVRFETGAKITGYQLSATNVKAGASFGFMVQGESGVYDRNIYRQELWLHAIPDGSSAMSFDGYITMTNLLRATELNKDKINPWLAEVIIPPDTPPGTYRLRTGFWIPSQRKRVKVTGGETPHDRRGSMLTTIEVVK